MVSLAVLYSGSKNRPGEMSPCTSACMLEKFWGRSDKRVLPSLSGQSAGPSQLKI